MIVWFRATPSRRVSSLAKMRAISETPEYVDGDIETDAEYYRYTSARLFADRSSGVRHSSIALAFPPEDIVKARAIEDRLYAQTWLSRVRLTARVRKLSRRLWSFMVITTSFRWSARETLLKQRRDHALLCLVTAALRHLERPVEVLNAIATFPQR
jgi:hypothetical protein